MRSGLRNRVLRGLLLRLRLRQWGLRLLLLLRLRLDSGSGVIMNPRFGGRQGKSAKFETSSV